VKMKYCCNPFKKQKHRKRVKKLYKLNVNLIEKLKSVGIFVGENDEVCSSCRFSIFTSKMSINHTENEMEIGDQGAEIEIEIDEQTAVNAQSSEQSDQSEYGSFPELDIAKLNFGLAAINESPISQRKLRSRKYCEQKINQITSSLNAKVFKTEAKSDFEEIMQQFKTKYDATNSNDEKYLILTSMPQSWSAYRIVKEFGCSLNMANKSKQLAEEKGIMTKPTLKLSKKKLPDSVVKLVKDFYYDEDCTRECAGKKECRTVYEDGNKVVKQQRLMINNINEAYVLFKERYLIVKVGISKFAELRPKEVVLTMDRGGVHFVCVCEKHQNFKLMFDPLKKLNVFTPAMSYKEFIQSVLCGVPTEKCYFNPCENCPNISNVENVLQTKLTEQIIDDLEIKQWISVNGNFLFRNT
jgi:hypothetical protein